MSACRTYCLLLGLLLAATLVHSEELWLADNTRIYGIVSGATANGEALQVFMPDCTQKEVRLEDVIAISFRGRPPRFIQTGTQEFIFLRGGTLRGEIIGQADEAISAGTAASGNVSIDPRQLTGLLGLPVEGSVGRRAQQLLRMGQGAEGPHLDILLDRRGSRYPGVVRRVDRLAMTLDHEDVLRPVPFPLSEIAGVRLADADRTPLGTAPKGTYLRFTLRDGSRFDAVLKEIRLGTWYVQPLWQDTGTIPLDINEVVIVQTMNGKVQYLSQLLPVKTEEMSAAALPQTYRVDANCQGGTLSVGGKIFPWGLGVHANSRLTYALDGRFKEFHALAGLDSHLGKEGQAIFTVVGDGKQLFQSTVAKGGEPPLEIKVPVAGVKQLLLSVMSPGGNDFGDAANWCVARVTR